MRKICSFTLAALLFFGCLPALSSCKGEEARTQYTIEAEYFEEGRLTGEMTVYAVNRTQNPLQELCFALYPNAFSKEASPALPAEYHAGAYYAGESYGGIEITSCTGGAHSLSNEGNLLRVRLPEAIYPDEGAEVTLSFTVTLAKVNHRLGVGEHTVGLAYFYPVLCAMTDAGFLEYLPAALGDPFVFDCADYAVTLRVPSALTAVAAGEVERGADGAYHVVARGVREVTFVLGDFACARAEGELPIDYYYMEGEAQPVLKAARESLEYFSASFAQYPYPRYVLVQADLPFAGMEYCGLSLLSLAARAEELPFITVHETAHQWWYALVGSDQFGQAWQDEGLAEYSCALFFEAHPEYGISYRALVSSSERAYRTFFSVQAQLGEANAAMSRPLTSFSGTYEYRSIAYDKGVVLFDRVRELVGEGRMRAALKEYARKYAGKLAPPEALIACFPAAAEGVFRSFTEGLCVI